MHSGIVNEEGISEEYGMKDTWMDAMIVKRLAAEEEAALATRLSMLDDLGAIRIQVGGDSCHCQGNSILNCRLSNSYLAQLSCKGDSSSV